MHFSTWSCQHIWFLYFGCIYWQPGPPTEDCKGKYHSSNFSVKNEGCVYKNSHSFFLQYSRQGRPLNQVILMTILIEKSKIKSIASRVRSNSFYWAFKDVDPRLCPVWHMNLQQYLSDNIETIQKRAFRCIFRGASYAEKLSNVGLQTLKDRPDCICKKIFQ